MQVGFSVSSKIEVDNNIDSLNIDTSSKDISADKTSSLTIFEIVIDSASVGLLHFRVNIEAGISEMSNFLG
jgi:hypothetical protein